MCGFVGVVDPSALTGTSGEILSHMIAALHHRGPDDTGIWRDAAAGAWLAHARLSIIDLSQEGHQPMVSASGRYVIAYNGEVYNHGELRAELTGEGAADWRGTSDTEVMLAAIDAWGLAQAVRRFNGIFAFALWDRKERALSLVRDRLGVKPLYYTNNGRTVLFGSELKALRRHPAFDAQIDRDAVALFTRHCYVPAPYSIYRGTCKVEPGSILTFRSGRSRGIDDADTEVYWSAKDVAEAGQSELLDATPDEMLDTLEKQLRHTVRQQMVADVPLGAFLSGGIDSSLVVALMQQASVQPVRTFTIGFQDEAFNEADHARDIAQHLGTVHEELIVTPQQAMATIPSLPAIFDEPFSDSSQIPTLIVSHLARQQVKVVLSGDGGDELFAGYDRYAAARRYWKIGAWIPADMRRRLMTGLLHGRGVLEGFPLATLAALGDGSSVASRWDERAIRLARRFRHAQHALFYRDFTSHVDSPSELVHGAIEPPTALTSRAHKPALDDATHEMMYFDSVSYLPDDILVKVDRASMSHSLEARVPLLDHELFELAWRMPLSMKVRDGQTKWALRQVLYRHVPRTLIERPKQGFGVPMSAWLRGPLREWAEALLDERRLREEGFLHADFVRQMWAMHVSGRKDLSRVLWDILMFEAWLDTNKIDALEAA